MGGNNSAMMGVQTLGKGFKTEIRNAGVVGNHRAGLNNWVFIFSERDGRLAQDVVSTLQQLGRGQRLEISAPQMEPVRPNQHGGVQAFVQVFKKTEQYGKKLQAAVCLVPRDDNETIYSAFKCKY